MIKANTERAGQLVAVGGGMAFPDRIVIEVQDEPETAFDLTIEVEYSDELRRYWVRDLQLKARSSSVEITMRNINRLTIQEYVVTGLSQLAFFDISQAKFMGFTALSFVPGIQQALTESGAPSDTLRSVYLTYRIGEILNIKPTKHMAASLSVPYATGADWLGKARRNGVFTEMDDITKDIAKLAGIPTPNLSKALLDGNH